MRLNEPFCSLALLAFAFSLLSVAGQDNPPQGGTFLVEAENQVRVKHGTGAWEKPPGLPTALAIGDRVQTGELSRAAVRLTNLSIVRLDELTNIEILPPPKESTKESLNISAGATYFFSREKPHELEVRTPSATGALRGTEFVVRVTGNLTQMTMLDGEVELHNAAGSIVLHSGEQGEVEVGGAPHKTAVIETRNVIQWSLYYPGVLDPRDLGLSETDQRQTGDSLAAYRAGDLLGALEKYPPGTRPPSAAGRLYFAAVLLAVGRVDEAQRQMSGVPPASPGRRALEQMISAVKLQDWSQTSTSPTVSESMAQSYYFQSKAQLEAARSAVQHAVEKAPDFGYAWVHLAELEFSFGRTPEALKALNRGLALSPRNAQAYALRGFLLSAENEIEPARAAFDHAIELDGALGNAWLGRGLTWIRQGQVARGLHDLQTAAALEPNRSILHSYLAKAFSAVDNVKNANKDLLRAKQLDPKDPTPWLYSAIQNKQENRYNQAIGDLEKSLALNDNRGVYRSSFLLDQDRSIRGTNLAAIYLNDGMVEQSVREADRAVDADYDSAPAHLFLANSYNALRDPDRYLLRYETPWFNELLLSNLLSPVGGGPLSQFVTEQEYSKMFQHDGFGISSDTTYFSNSELQETASQFGTFGNFSYALDTQYLYDHGQRPNDQITSVESYAEFKYQVGPQDTLFFQTKFEDQNTGNVGPIDDPASVNGDTEAQTLKFHEQQDPGLLLLGWHHEWSPGNHTLLLLGRLENQQNQTSQDTPQPEITRDVSAYTTGLALQQGLYNNNSSAFLNPFSNPVVYQTLSGLAGKGPIQNVETIPLNYDYDAHFHTYSTELQQIFTFDSDTLIFGDRFQTGEFDTENQLTDTTENPNFSNALAAQSANVGFQRNSLYVYNIWHVAPWLSLTGGLAYDLMTYPSNFRSPPINHQQQTLDKVSPKVGFILQPMPGTTLRASYAEAISGASFDESVRLEPTEIDGFTQAYRTLASESILGSVAGSRYNLGGVSLEQKLPTRTYLAFEYDNLEQRVDRTEGAFERFNAPGYPVEILPASLGVKDTYREDVFSETVNQLVGDCWSFGARYSYTHSHLAQQMPELQNVSPNVNSAEEKALTQNASTDLKDGLHQVVLSALFNHPSGFFANADAKWFKQTNEAFHDPVPAGDDFWQFDVNVGYRFYRNQCQIGCGILDLNNADYRLDPLNPYLQLPRSRTFVANFKFSF